MTLRTHRRNFLKSAVVAGAGTVIVSDLLAQESPNEKVAFACVGIGGKGQSDSEDAKKFGQVVAFCDTNRNQLKGGTKRFEGAKPFEDFREMFDKMGDSIDAFTVSTPDHMHAPIAAYGMLRGKHVYCQKPLTRTISEARALAQIAKKNKIVSQMGNQMAADTNARETEALLRAGLVGNVQKVIVWTNRPIWPQGGERGEAAPVPAYLNWKCWLGVAPERPFVPGAYDPFAWRGWWDFGTGALGDMACHTLHVPTLALTLRDPISVQATTSGHNFDSFPKWSEINFEFPAIGDRPALQMQWLDGGKRPSPDQLCGQEPYSSAFVVIGDDGVCYSPDDYGRTRVLGGNAKDKEADMLEAIRKEGKIREAPRGHFGEFVDGIKMGDPLYPVSNMITHGGGITETILLGNLAVWAASEPDKLGQKIEWDAQNLKILGNPADRERLESLVFPKYENGYEQLKPEM